MALGCVGDSDALAVVEGEAPLDRVAVPLPVLVGEAVGVGDGDRAAEALPLRDWLGVTEGLSPTVSEAVGVREREALRVAVVEGVLEGVGDGVGVALPVGVALGVEVALGLLERDQLPVL